MSVADSMYNLQLIREFCESHLKSCCPLQLEDLLYAPPTLQVRDAPPILQVHCALPTLQVSYATPTLQVHCALPTLQVRDAPPILEVRWTCSIVFILNHEMYNIMINM